MTRKTAAERLALRRIPPAEFPRHATAEPAEDRAGHHVEWLVQRNRQDTGIGYRHVEPHAIRTVGIVGAGMMGTAIAARHVKAGLPVVITDVDHPALVAAAERITAELAGQAESSSKGRMAQARQLVDRLVQPTSDVRIVARCDLVLESVAETRAAKQEVYQRLEPHMPRNTILASNTSTIPIGQLAAGLAAPARFCGIHFFHPVRHRSLVEIVRGQQTSDETVATAVGFAKQIDKMPIVVEDGPAFLVNRLLLPYLIEAMDLLLDGATIDQVERAATEFGMAIGPLRILDEIGIDTVVNAGRVLWQAFPDRLVASPLLITMYKQGRLGRKSGSGFFAYSSETAWDGPARPDPAVEPLIAEWARPPQKLTPELITHRLILPMVLEATRLLEEKKVRHPADIDLAVLFGLGFPASRGGVLYWADALGPDRILETLRPLQPLGPRLKPTRLLLETAEHGRRFYDWHSA